MDGSRDYMANRGWREQERRDLQGYVDTGRTLRYYDMKLLFKDSVLANGLMFGINFQTMLSMVVKGSEDRDRLLARMRMELMAKEGDGPYSPVQQSSWRYIGMPKEVDARVRHFMAYNGIMHADYSGVFVADEMSRWRTMWVADRLLKEFESNGGKTK